MLEKPDLSDERLMAGLYAAYGWRASGLEFLPIGADVNTAVYRVTAGADQRFLPKLRRGPVDEMSVVVPACLAGQGLRPIIAPIQTTSGQLFSTLDPYTLTLYLFVAGADGYAVDLSEAQWVELSAAVRGWHTARLPATLQRRLQTQAQDWVVCHADLHNGNSLIAKDGALHRGLGHGHARAAGARPDVCGFRPGAPWP